ncbi:hypothetical protein B0T10DRAFT_416941 [Thelonectria olida]|uniref:Uncharacterized protein n=1 Tax=Thelonectria olida TaxID=1576542 RepID=A0A9P8VT48_9HYPO|nr:hypothetical protein B0T10DRAFT_416941 [Thelonectria olida]
MDDTTLGRHLKLLQSQGDLDEVDEILTAPIFTEPVKSYVLSAMKDDKQGKEAFNQYGLLAADIRERFLGSLETVHSSVKPDPRIFYNVAAPSSVFICGSQGSGKSHTLSCLLENCLVPSEATVLPRPLTGLVFHYDTFVSDTGSLPCEAAFLSSEDCVKVRVLCPPTNIQQVKRIYACLPNVEVEELRINESDLTTKRMLDLMAVSSIQGGGMPLYLHVVTRILRDLRVQQQHSGMGFDYSAFQRALASENLSEGQRAPLQQRLETLESFMVKKQVESHDLSKSGKATGQKKKSKRNNFAVPTVDKGNDWAPVSGQLTIVDLSCPCVTAEIACALFNICLSLFLEQDSRVGRVVALDEAHKYMMVGAEGQTLTESLLSTIRLQRHIGVRVIISTQEPTISPRLLDLCSVTIVHRFSSPDWLQSLRRHLVGVSVCEVGASRNGADNAVNGTKEEDRDGFDSISPNQTTFSMNLLSQIVGLRRGEALMFAPSAVIDTEGFSSTSTNVGSQLLQEPPYTRISPLGKGLLKVRIRQRLTADGGRSVLAS